MTNNESMQSGSEIPDSAIDAALRGHRTGTHPGLDHAADAMNALRRPADTAELGGQDDALAAYRQHGPRPRAGVGPRRIALLPAPVGLRLLGTAGGAAVALGAVATVLFATSMGPAAAPQTLPVGAGSSTTAVSTAKPSPGSTEGDEGQGPDAKGPAAFGLCNAWANHQRNGTDADESKTDDPEDSTAFRNLAAAAGGKAKIGQYCAKVPHPGQGRGHGVGQSGKGNSGKHGKPAQPGKPDKPAKPAHPKGDDDQSESPKPTSTAKPTLTAPARPTLPTPTTTTATTTTSASTS